MLETDRTYRLSLEYEAGGAGRALFEEDEVILRLDRDVDPRSVKFVI